MLSTSGECGLFSHVMYVCGGLVYGSASPYHYPHYITLLQSSAQYVFHPCTLLQVPATKRRVMRVSGRATTWSAEPASVLPAPSHHLQLRQISSL